MTGLVQVQLRKKLSELRIFKDFLSLDFPPTLSLTSHFLRKKNSLSKLQSHFVAQNSPPFSAALPFRLTQFSSTPTMLLNIILSTCQSHTQSSKHSLWGDHLSDLTCNEWGKRFGNGGGYFIFWVLLLIWISSLLTWQGSWSNQELHVRCFVTRCG